MNPFAQIRGGEISVSRQLHGQHMARPGWVLLAALGAIVLAFMVLSLAITATGTARFAMAMGYPAEVGYVIGAIFDIAKDVLSVALLVLLTQRAFFFFAIIGSAWLGLVTYSCLATHATVSTAIAAIERSGSWKMESRSNFKAELAAVEQRLAALSKPAPPRPSKTLAETLAAEKVPPGVWRDSQECQAIHDSKYFQRACAKVLDLRRELAAAEDYEKLDARARELRQALSATPVVATSDPLPEAFAATVGRLLQVEGHVGVALLLTGVIEIMSCFGLATLKALREGGRREELFDQGQVSPSPIDEGRVSGRTVNIPDSAADIAADGLSQIIPPLSLKAAGAGFLPYPALPRDEQPKPPSNVVPIVRANRREPRAREASGMSPHAPRGTISVMGSHVPEFARKCLLSAAGSSLGASELRAAYEVWCAVHGQKPLSMQKLGAELSGLGYAKWKSCGLIRYRDLQLVA